MSFLEQDYAILTRHSFAIFEANSSFTVPTDFFVYSNQILDAHAPGLSFYILPFAALGFYLQSGYSSFGWPLRLSEFAVAISGALAVFLFYKISRRYFSEKTCVFLSLAFAFSTLLFDYATNLYPSAFVAMLDLLTVYCVLNLRDQGDKMSLAAGAGLAIGFSILTDYVQVAFAVVVFFYICFTKKARTSDILAYIATLVIALLLLGLYNSVAFGEVFRTSEQLYQGSQSIVLNFSFPVWLGLYYDLFSPVKGILVYDPILLLSLFGFYLMLKKKELQGQAVLFLTLFFSVLLPYSMWQALGGGDAYGQRFLVSVLAFFLLPAGFVLERSKSKISKVGIYALYGLGVIIAAVGVFVGTWNAPQRWDSNQFLESMTNLLSGHDNYAFTWMVSLTPIEAFLVIQVTISVLVILPLFLNHLGQSRKAFHQLEHDLTS